MEKILRPDSLIWRQLVYKVPSLLGRVSYQFVGLLHVGTLQTGDDRGAKTHFLHDVDQTLGDGITPDDTTEDVNEDGGDLRVTSDKLECRLDSRGSSTATNVKEVGRAAAIEFDDIHSSHGKTSTIDYA